MPALSKLAKARRKLILKWRRFLGLCIGCGADAWGNALCDRCQDRQNKATAKRREKLKTNNLCQECGKNIVNSGGYRCDSCIELMRLRKDKRICVSDGCCNVAAFGMSLCQDCIDLKESESQSCKVYFVKCPDCKKLFTANNLGLKRCWNCKEIKRKKSDRDAKRAKKGLKLLKKTCAYYRCNNTFFTYDSKKITCSKLCSKRMMQRNKGQRERVRRNLKRLGNKYIETVDLRELFIRDHGRCRICGRKLNLIRSNNHKLQATVDHIIPLSQGGEHSYRNTQLACRQCNSLKGNRTVAGGEQLRLFG